MHAANADAAAVHDDYAAADEWQSWNPYTPPTNMNENSNAQNNEARGDNIEGEGKDPE